MKFTKKLQINFLKRMVIEMGSMEMDSKQGKVPKVSVKIKKITDEDGIKKPVFVITGLNKLYATEEARKELYEIYKQYLEIANINNGKLKKSTIEVFEKHIELWLNEKLEDGGIVNVEEE